MKTRLLIILFTLSILFPMNDIFAPPSANLDWQNYPYCPGGCSHEYLVTEWTKYYDMKGEKWMEQKRTELFDAYNNGTLDEWIDSDPTKGNQNTFTYYYILGQIANSDGDFFDMIPSCNVGVFVSDNIQCYIEDSPPCPEPSFKKNGLCVVEKNDICEKGNVLTDGMCIPNTGSFRIDDPTFTKQHLLTGKPILNPNPDDFRESGDHINLLYAYSGLSLVGIVIGFFVIKKWRNRK